MNGLPLMPDAPSTAVLQKTVPANAVYFPALDGLRALALMMVFVAHYGDVPLFGVGVNLFFVLSGFLITGILWDTRDQLHRVRNFYVRRTLRIFPLYYGVFLVLLASTPVFHWAWNSAWWLWPAYLGNFAVYMPAWLPQREWVAAANGQLTGAHHVVLYVGHFWSLCVEEQFYLIWPWVVFRAGRRSLLWICGIVVVTLPFLRLIAAHMLPQGAVNANILFRTLPFQMDALLAGGLLAMLLRGQFRPALFRSSRIVADAALFATIFFIYCCVDLHVSVLHQPFIRHFGALSWELSVVDALGVALVLGALHPASCTYTIFNLAPLRWIGRISYGAYVFHDIPHSLYSHIGRAISPTHSKSATLLVAMMVTMLVSFLSFKYFEKPFLRLKERWTLRAN